MRQEETNQGRYASQRQAESRGLEAAGRDAVCAIPPVEEEEERLAVGKKLLLALR
jgi:hypothetical protein